LQKSPIVGETLVRFKKDLQHLLSAAQQPE
jgi:hypothetical protein